MTWETKGGHSRQSTRTLRSAPRTGDINTCDSALQKCLREARLPRDRCWGGDGSGSRHSRFYSTSMTQHASTFRSPQRSWAGLLSSTWPLSVLAAWSFTPHLELLSLWEDSPTPGASLVTCKPVTYMFHSSSVVALSSQPIDPTAFWISKIDFTVFFPNWALSQVPYPRAQLHHHPPGTARTQELFFPSASPLPNILPRPVGPISQTSMETPVSPSPPSSTTITKLGHCSSLLRGSSIAAVTPHPNIRHTAANVTFLKARCFSPCRSCLKSLIGFPQLLE